MTNRRSYEQFCALAQALDRVGGRWTFLIVRELLPGPARFNELLEGLPGIATNLLSTRLRQLEADGLVAHRRLPPPASVDAYELTERGRGLEPAVSALSLWGARYLLEVPFEEPQSIRGCALAAKAFLPAELTQGTRATVDFDFHDGRVLSVVVADGSVDVVLGPHPDPEATVPISFGEFLLMASGQYLPSQTAIDATGDLAALRRLEEAFGRAALTRAS